MARRFRHLTDYDRAVRALDMQNTYPDRPIVERFINEPESQQKRDHRCELLGTLEYYRDPQNMEEYHMNYLHIQSKMKGIIPFRWKHAQRVFWEQHILPQILNNEPVRVYVLKARQIGFSTQIEGIGSSFCNLFSDIRASVVAHDKDTSAKIFRMCKLFYRKLPSNFKPAQKLSNRHELELANPLSASDELGLESAFSVGTAKNLHLGAGTTLKFIHLSEFARYEEVNSEAENALVSLFQTIPRLGGTFTFIETTAYGEGMGKRWWDDKYNGFKKVFVSWLAEEEYTLNEPVDPTTLGYDEKNRYGNEVQAREHIIKELAKWNPEYATDEEWLKYQSLCRLNWRRQTINEQTAGKVDLFQQEYPSTPEEAFRITGRSVFNTYNLTLMKTAAEKLQSTNYTYVHNGAKPKQTNEFIKENLGELKIFIPPNPQSLYFLGVDVSAGSSDGDNSVIQVVDDRYRQVAVYCNKIEPDELAYPVVTLAKLYNNARIIPEANTHGLNTIARMTKDLGYGNIYIRKHINRVDGGITNEWGFYTSQKTRPQLINTLRDLISSNILRLFDTETIHEFLNFIFVNKNGIMRMESSPGVHDDRVLAMGLAVIEIPSYVQSMEEKEHDEPPVGSMEWYARKMDINDDYGNDFGSVLGV